MKYPHQFGGGNGGGCWGERQTRRFGCRSSRTTGMDTVRKKIELDQERLYTRPLKLLRLEKVISTIAFPSSRCHC